MKPAERGVETEQSLKRRFPLTCQTSANLKALTERGTESEASRQVSDHPGNFIHFDKLELNWSLLSRKLRKIPRSSSALPRDGTILFVLVSSKCPHSVCYPGTSVN